MKNLIFFLFVSLIFIGCGSSHKLNTNYIGPVDFETHSDVIDISQLKFNDVLWLNDDLMYFIFENDEEKTVYELNLTSKEYHKLDKNNLEEILLIKHNLKSIEELPDTSSTIEKVGKGVLTFLDVLSVAGGRGSTFSNFMEHSSHECKISSYELTNNVTLIARTYYNYGDKQKSELDESTLEIEYDNEELLKTKYSMTFSNAIELELHRIWYLSPNGQYLILGNKLIDLFEKEKIDLNKSDNTANYFFVPNPSWTEVGIINGYSMNGTANKMYFSNLKIF